MTRLPATTPMRRLPPSGSSTVCAWPVLGWETGDWKFSSGVWWWILILAFILSTFRGTGEVGGRGAAVQLLCALPLRILCLPCCNDPGA